MDTNLIREKIYEIRGQKIMLDFDLAELYGVETRVFNQAVKRNIDRFPEDFMFRLTPEEWEALKHSSQMVASADIVDSQSDKNSSQFVMSPLGPPTLRFLLHTIQPGQSPTLFFAL